jgi:hypothetical protein
MKSHGAIARESLDLGNKKVSFTEKGSHLKLIRIEFPPLFATRPNV